MWCYLIKGEGLLHTQIEVGRDKNTDLVGWVSFACYLRALRLFPEVCVFCLGELSKTLESSDF